jgi:molybdopterin-binding protein
VLEATVREVRPDGRSRIVSLDWGGRRVDALLTRAACEELDVRPGQVMYAAIKASAIQLLPKGRPGATDEQARSA